MNEKLVEYSNDGDLVGVQRCIENGDNVNSEDESGNTALLYASSRKHIEIVKYLIDSGASINFQNKHGYTALMCAAMVNSIEVVKTLVENNALIDLKDNKASTALLYASKSTSHSEIVEYLVKNGADVNVKNDEGITVLFYASSSNNLNQVKYLIDNGADININGIRGTTALIEASANKYNKMVEYLIGKGASINDQDENGYTALMRASEEGYFETVKYLADNGADINIQNKDGLTATALTKSKKIIQYLVGNDTLVKNNTIANTNNASDKKLEEEFLIFQCFEFKLAVLEVLMYKLKLITPFDIYKFAEQYGDEEIDIDSEEPIPAVIDYFRELAIPKRFDKYVESIDMDGGNDIYMNIAPLWTGEDGFFDINDITSEEILQFPNLKKVSLMSGSSFKDVSEVFRQHGIDVESC